MKAHLINTHLLVPRSRPSAKVKVKYQGHVFVSGAFSVSQTHFVLLCTLHSIFPKPLAALYTTQNLLRITFSFNDLMLKTSRLKNDFFYKDRLIFGLDDPVANMSIRHVYYA